MFLADDEAEGNVWYYICIEAETPPEVTETAEKELATGLV